MARLPITLMNSCQSRRWVVAVGREMLPAAGACRSAAMSGVGCGDGVAEAGGCSPARPQAGVADVGRGGSPLSATFACKAAARRGSTELPARRRGAGGSCRGRMVDRGGHRDGR